MANAGGQDDESIGDLLARLVDDAREYVRAEVGVYRELAVRRLVASRAAMALTIGGVLLAFASVTALMVALVLWVSFWLGPIGAGLAVAVGGLLVAALMIRAAVGRFKPLASFDEELDS